MTNLIPKVEVDNFQITSSGIEAFCLIDGESVDFHINQDDFETFIDKHELRDFENSTWNHRLEDFDTESGTTPWVAVYEDRTKVYEFLKGYIECLYADAAMDIESPIKSIVSSHKKAI